MTEIEKASKKTAEKTTQAPQPTQAQEQMVTQQQQQQGMTTVQEVTQKYEKLLYLAKRERPDIAILGDGEVFIRRIPGGNAIKAVTGKVTLLEEKSEFYEIEGSDKRPAKFPITAIGYGTLNKIANVSIITPKHLIIPDTGKEVINPHIILGYRDPNSGKNTGVQGVWVKKMALGYSPLGNLVITSSTLFYNVEQYLITDILKKYKYNKKIGHYVNEPALKEFAPEEYKKMRLTGKFYLMDEELSFWVDFTELEFHSVMETNQGSKLFAERKAVTIAERNCLKKHPAIAETYVLPYGIKGKRMAQVKVIGWMNDLTKEDLDRIADQADKGQPIKVNGVEAAYIDNDVEDQITQEDEIIESGTFDNDEETPPDREDEEREAQEILPEAPAPKQEVDSKIVDAKRSNLMELGGRLGDAEFAKIIQKTFKTSVDKLAPGQVDMAMTVVSRALDKKDNQLF